MLDPLFHESQLSRLSPPNLETAELVGLHVGLRFVNIGGDQGPVFGSWQSGWGGGGVGGLGF